MMTRPPKASTIPRNQPVVFDESLATSLPAMGAPVRSTATAASDQPDFNRARLVLGAIWVLAAVCAGIGVGLLLRPATQLTVFDPGTPIAAADLALTSAAAASESSLAIAPAAPVSGPDLAVLPAVAVNQAQAGTTLVTVSLLAYQPAAGTNFIQPGYLHFGRTQGNAGTAAVR